MEINKNITSINRTVMNNKKNKYIVIHYVGAVSSARNNTIYFKSTYRGASAHYFVDTYSIWQCVEDKDASWHCGSTKGYYHPECRNTNSISIEMCCYENNGELDIDERVVEKTIQLVIYLMEKYGIPKENIIRHYDVTRKNCPAPFVKNIIRWTSFKMKLGDSDIITNEIDSYRVKVTANVLNIRSGAGIDFSVVGQIKNKGVYTIIDEVDGWGKLKSGAGWIKLSYTVKI